MKRRMKRTKFVDLIVLLGIISALVLIIRSFSVAAQDAVEVTQETIHEIVGDDCQDNRNWFLNDYKILETRCLALEGPAYYQFSLYKKDSLVIANALTKDSCLVEFLHQKELVSINVCDEKMVVAKIEDSISNTLNAKLR